MSDGTFATNYRFTPEVLENILFIQVQYDSRSIVTNVYTKLNIKMEVYFGTHNNIVEMAELINLSDICNTNRIIMIILNF